MHPASLRWHRVLVSGTDVERFVPVTRFSACLMLLLALVAGCSASHQSDLGASGLPRSKLLVDLTASERVQFCRWYEPLFDGGGSYPCPGGFSSIVAGFDHCVSERWPPSCPVTVAEAERCDLASAADVCATSLPECPPHPECRPLPSEAGEAPTDAGM